jgi:hypothetical protein
MHEHLDLSSSANRGLNSDCPAQTQLKLVVSNQTPASPINPHPLELSKTGFNTKLQSHGPSVYCMTANDPSHLLNCEIFVEVFEDINDDHNETKVVSCHYPIIPIESLSQYVWEDEVLTSMILVSFQMKIMQQLLFISNNHYASLLRIYAEEDQVDSLEIYRNFLEDEGVPQNHWRDAAQLVIPVNEQTIQAWEDFMNSVTLQFHQTLWRDQRMNPAMRQYLKDHPLG